MVNAGKATQNKLENLLQLPGLQLLEKNRGRPRFLQGKQLNNKENQGKLCAYGFTVTSKENSFTLFSENFSTKLYPSKSGENS